MEEEEMSRSQDRSGTKRSAKVNWGKPAGHNQKRELYGSWFKRPYGKAVKKLLG